MCMSARVALTHVLPLPRGSISAHLQTAPGGGWHDLAVNLKSVSAYASYVAT